MIDTCIVCGESDVVIDDEGFCEHCYNTFMYEESKKKAQFDADIKDIEIHLLK